MVETKLQSQCPGWRRLKLKFESDEEKIVQTNPGHTRRRTNGILVMPIPIGKLEHQQIIATITFASTIFAAILLCILILKVDRTQDKDKKKHE